MFHPVLFHASVGFCRNHYYNFAAFQKKEIPLALTLCMTFFGITFKDVYLRYQKLFIHYWCCDLLPMYNTMIDRVTASIALVFQVLVEPNAYFFVNAVSKTSTLLRLQIKQIVATNVATSCKIRLKSQ